MRAKNPLWSAAVVFLSIYGCSSTDALAQSGQTEVGELAAFGGGIFGGGAHAAVGASAGVALTRYGMLLFETSFMPLGQQTIQPWPARSEVRQSYLYDFSIDVNIRIPVRQHWEPYVIAGVPLLWNTLRQATVTASGAPILYHYNQLNGGFHTGGGVRYYIGRNWGIRPEVKLIVSQSTYTRVSIGIFYNTSGEMP